MARDDDDDFDDEEYRPRRRGEGRPRGTPVPVVIGLGVVAVVVLGAFVLVFARGRHALDQARRALGEDEAQAARAVAEHEKRPAVAVEKARTNWEKVVGMWVRHPGPKDKEKGGPPYRFEFRKDKTARTIRTNFDGQPQEREGRVDVMADSGNILWIRMEVPGGTMSYQFQLMEDGTLALTSEPGAPLFVRAK